MGARDMKDASPAVVCTDVWKIFRKQDQIIKALKGASLTMKPGSIVVLRGASGSGKSTLLNLIGALDVPTTGAVSVLGTDLGALGDTERGAFRRHHIGFVFQELVLVPHLTALENTALALAFDHPRIEALQKGTELLRDCGLGERLNHRPAELSYGERQRVAVARAAMRTPKIILADEPTANLDDVSTERVVRIFTALRDAGTSLLIATHDPRLEQCADEVRVLEDGLLSDYTT
jgi:ABC-type lipoprotein export system ATPase subunit